MIYCFFCQNVQLATLNLAFDLGDFLATLSYLGHVTSLIVCTYN